MGERSPHQEVLPFKQTGEFHYRRGMRYWQNNNIPDAFHHLWRAVDIEPDNSEYSLNLAKLLYDVQRFEESNGVLLMVMQRLHDVPAEYYFALGCNFYEMRDWENAANCLRSYLQSEDSSEYCEDAGIMLDSMEEEDPEEPDGEDQEDTQQETARRGTEALQDGEIAKAIALLETVALPGPEGVEVRNDLALALYLDGKPAQARAVTEQVLLDNPGHQQSLYYLALFTHREDSEKARQIIGRAEAIPEDDPYQNFKMGMILCEMGEHARGLRLIEPMALQHPFHYKVQHYYALAQYNNGHIGQAITLWEQMKKMYPQDGTVIWCRRRALAVLESGEPPAPIDYAMKTPLTDAVERMRDFSRRLLEPRREDAWRDMESLRMLLMGLSPQNSLLRKAALQMLVASSGRDCESLLRRMLLDPDESDDFKQEIFVWLRVVDAPQPYIAIMNRSIVQVRVEMRSAKSEEAVEGYQQVVEHLCRHLLDREQEPVVAAIRIWNAYLSAMIQRGNWPRIRNPKAWAAALHYWVMARAGQKTTYRQAAEIYETTASAVGRCARKLNPYNTNDEVSPRGED